MNYFTSIVLFFNSIANGFDLTQFGNPNGRWETNTSTNIGIDASMLKGKIEFVLDLYTRTTSNMLTQVPIPKTAGTGSVPYVNIGEVNNKGLDLNITYKNKMGDLDIPLVVCLEHTKTM